MFGKAVRIVRFAARARRLRLGEHAEVLAHASSVSRRAVRGCRTSRSRMLQRLPHVRHDEHRQPRHGRRGRTSRDHVAIRPANRQACRVSQCRRPEVVGASLPASNCPRRCSTVPPEGGAVAVSNVRHVARAKSRASARGRHHAPLRRVRLVGDREARGDPARVRRARAPVPGPVEGDARAGTEAASVSSPVVFNRDDATPERLALALALRSERAHG
jgi:hypothetical protein